MLYVRMIDGMSNVTVDDELSFQTNFLNDEGIVNHSGTDLQVQAQAAPDLTVKVKAGTCYVKRDAWTATSGTLKFWETVLDADANVTIPANSSGGTIRRIICMKIDTGVSPDANASNVASLVVVSGTSGGGDPTIPDNHLPLARVIHNNADTSIASGDITDLRVTTGVNGEMISVASQTVGDLLYFDGTKWTRKPSAEVASGDGWLSPGETWTYASASTFTVSGNQTAKYSKGTRLKFTQTTVKYAVVVASSYSAPNTTVTIAVNTDYTIANAAITSPYYSYQAGPQGYPGWFAYTPTWTGFSADPAYAVAPRFSIIGRQCRTVAIASANGTSNSTSMTMTLPAVAAQSLAYIGGRGVDNGAILTSPALLATGAGSATGTWTTWASGVWTASGAKSVNWDLSYEI